MNPSSKASATMATTMAFRTKAAGLNFRIVSKTDAIAESKRCVGAPLRAFLIAGGSRNVLRCCESKPKPSAVGMRREAPKLVHRGKVLCSGREENISCNAAITRTGQWKGQTSGAGRPPFRRNSRKAAACARQRKRQREFTGEVKEGRAGNGHDSRGR